MQVVESYIWDDKKAVLVLNNLHYSKVSDIQHHLSDFARLNRSAIRRFDLVDHGQVRVEVEDAWTADYLESVFHARRIDDAGVSHYRIYSFDLNEAVIFLTDVRNQRTAMEQSESYSKAVSTNSMEMGKEDDYEKVTTLQKIKKTSNKNTSKSKKTSKPKSKKKRR